MFIKPETKNEYVTDFGITVRDLLGQIPNLRELEIEFSCLVKCYHTPGTPDTNQTIDLLRGKVEGFLEFQAPWNCEGRPDSAGVIRYVTGNIVARPLRGKEPEMSARGESRGRR